MMYPKKTPSQSRADQELKKQLSLKQREQLKSLMSTKLSNKYPDNDVNAMKDTVNKYFDQQQTLTADNLRELDKNAGLVKKASNPFADRDDISVKSGISKMSGATDFLSPDNMSDLNNAKTQTTSVIDLALKTKRPEGKKYRNDEEEWADIYKYNQGVYKAEAQIEAERREFNKLKFRSELDDQVTLKKQKKVEEADFTLKADMDMVNHKVRREEIKEQKRIDLMKERTALEKIMRDKQIKENVAKRKHEIKEQKNLDKYIVSRIREEQIEDEKAAKKKRLEDYANYRKMLQDNEEKRVLMLQDRDQERKEEIRQIEEYNRMVEAREKQRDDELKAKDVKTRQILEAAKGLLGKPSDERERRQDMKVAKWAIKKEKEDKDIEAQEKMEAYQKKLNTKHYLTEQMEEKAIRKIQEKRENDEQAKHWLSSAEQYLVWEKQKEEEKKKQMKMYSDVLKKQMTEKFEERRITDRLFDLRATLNGE